MAVRTVLSVDDSTEDVILLRFACHAAKVCFGIQSVDSGETAIAYLEGSHGYADREKFPVPDLVLLDLKMPGKSGFDVLTWVRAHRSFGHMPIVVFTSSIHPEDRARALELGANQYLVKPVSYEALKRLMGIIDRSLASAGALDLRMLDVMSLQPGNI